MEIIAAEDISAGVDLFPPLTPLTFSLYDSFLTSHCSSRFSPLNPPPPKQSPPSLYCSASCSRMDSPIVSPPDIPSISSSDIRAAFRLVNSLPSSSSSPHRLGGLLTNHHHFMADLSISPAIRTAADFLAAISGSNREDRELEEAAICSVLTNAVEVQDSSGEALGIAVYGPRFSWINHSCSPNSCYRFVISPPNLTTSSDPNPDPDPKVIPRNTNKEMEHVGVYSITSLWEGKTVEYGPKVTTRSIMKIKSGEEITLSYIDILQPTGLRQSDLWLKYRFMCSCRRCAASPPAYVDSVLEGVLPLEPKDTDFVHHHGITNEDEAVGSLTDHIKEAIDDFLSDNITPNTCCERIESVLHQGTMIKADSHPRRHLRLHPFHHVSLNAYITLSTAYKIRSIDSETNMGMAFDMKRISAAYSLFLAGVSHCLFSAEPSLAMSAANFWARAGESLLDFANEFLLESCDVKCSKCLLLVETHSSLANIKENLGQILRCVTVTGVSHAAWSFLSRGCSYLENFNCPVDFLLAGRNGKVEEYSEEDRAGNVLLVSFHCLLYAAQLTDLCYGRKSYLLH